ncbi:MAG: hypothetical protein RMJ52_17650 [Gemmataceae bacterium]|nr:hypothetical protein [Gemmataceae bacterium]
MMSDWLWLVLAVGVLLGVALLIRPLRSWFRTVQGERAHELFQLQRERLEAMFLRAAAATGKPRGLRWKQCVFEPEIALARDRRSQQLLALVPVTIHFEAVEGSDMEGLPAVALPRSASAVFYFQGGQWQTAGKAVFNMSPVEALEHFKQHYEPVVR